MPPRPQPKIHHLQLKTHKLTIFLTVPPNTTILALKEDALSALQAYASPGSGVLTDTPQDASETVPHVDSGRGRTTGEYDFLDADDTKQVTVKECGISGWDTLFFRFKTVMLCGVGTFLPVTYTQTSIDDDEDEAPAPQHAPSMDDDYPVSSKSKGKRKARHDEDDDDE
ncbi:hypothetical protein BD779DRAFT_1566896 [Infundibulicybe gibba]|nr:hypothetical protein BD779DRAFT_1566896 [Infundibulicybe gibba]